ncbi:Hypothetical_protein [Hexamita inflata]|uniref:Hypothetical_protein n=1 Tax=Hexamita inflata TaxID=28002 RepID=A0AA86TPK4_9EUKA|nr:Hypothetical protein HINF_LOCUS11280 [Hexamita inflata]
MRLGQIGCGRQNPRCKMLSRIGMAKGIPSTSHQDWKAATAQLLPQKRRWYDTGGFPYRSAYTKQPHYPLMPVSESLVILVVDVRLLYIGVSETYDHSRGLTVSCTEDRTRTNESQVSGIYYMQIKAKKHNNMQLHPTDITFIYTIILYFYVLFNKQLIQRNGKSDLERASWSQTNTIFNQFNSRWMKFLYLYSSKNNISEQRHKRIEYCLILLKALLLDDTFDALKGLEHDTEQKK